MSADIKSDLFKGDFDINRNIAAVIALSIEIIVLKKWRPIVVNMKTNAYLIKIKENYVNCESLN
jgi:hypothetical protein